MFSILEHGAPIYLAVQAEVLRCNSLLFLPHNLSALFANITPKHIPKSLTSLNHCCYHLVHITVISYLDHCSGLQTHLLVPLWSISYQAWRIIFLFSITLFKVTHWVYLIVRTKSLPLNLVYTAPWRLAPTATLTLVPTSIPKHHSLDPMTLGWACQSVNLRVFPCQEWVFQGWFPLIFRVKCSVKGYSPQRPFLTTWLYRMLHPAP